MTDNVLITDEVARKPANRATTNGLSQFNRSTPIVETTVAQVDTFGNTGTMVVMANIPGRVRH